MKTGDVEGSDDAPFGVICSFSSVDPAFFNRFRDNLRQKLRQNFHRRSFDDVFSPLSPPCPRFGTGKVLLGLPSPPTEAEITGRLIHHGGLTQDDIYRWRDEGVTAYLAFLFPPSWALTRSLPHPRQTNSFSPINQMRTNFEIPDLLLRRRPVIEWKSRRSANSLEYDHQSNAAQRLMNRLVSNTRNRNRRKTERPPSIWGRHGIVSPLWKVKRVSAEFTPHSGEMLTVINHQSAPPIDLESEEADRPERGNSVESAKYPRFGWAEPALSPPPAAPPPSLGSETFSETYAPPNHRVTYGSSTSTCLRTASETYSFCQSPRVPPPSKASSESMVAPSKTRENIHRAYFCSRTFANGARRWDENGQCWVARKYRIRLHTSTGNLILDRPTRSENRKQQRHRSLRQRLFIEKSRVPPSKDVQGNNIDTLREDVSNELEIGRLGPDVHLGGGGSPTPTTSPPIDEGPAAPPSDVCALVINQLEMIERVTDLRQVKDRLDILGGLGCIALAELAAKKNAAPEEPRRRVVKNGCLPCRKKNHYTSQLDDDDEDGEGHFDDDSLTLAETAFLAHPMARGILLISCVNERPLVIVTDTEREAIQFVRIVSSLEEYWAT